MYSYNAPAGELPLNRPETIEGLLTRVAAPAAAFTTSADLRRMEQAGTTYDPVDEDISDVCDDNSAAPRPLGKQTLYPMTSGDVSVGIFSQSAIDAEGASDGAPVTLAQVVFYNTPGENEPPHSSQPKVQLVVLSDGSVKAQLFFANGQPNPSYYDAEVGVRDLLTLAEGLEGRRRPSLSRQASGSDMSRQLMLLRDRLGIDH